MHQSTAQETTGHKALPHRAGDDRVEWAFDRARRHSGRVRALKLALPAAAILLVAGFVFKSYIAVPEGLDITVEGAAIDSGRLVMSNPTLDGFTEDNRPYEMTAARAIQDIGSASRIDLEGIEATLPIDDGGWARIEAETGTFDRESNRLVIDSDVTIRTEDGMTARLGSANVDIAEGRMTTSDPVEIELGGTRIQAQGMSVEENGGVLVFEDRVRVEIDGKRLQAAARERSPG